MNAVLEDSTATPDTPEARKAIIDGLALQMVAAEEALKKGLDKTPEVVDQLDGQGALAGDDITVVKRWNIDSAFRVG